MVKPKLDIIMTKERPIGSVKQLFYTVKKKIGTKYADFEISEIYDILEGVEKKADKKANGKETKILIQALCPSGFKTLKSFDGDLNLNEYEEYFDSSVADPSKFNKLSQLQFIVSFQL